MASENPLLINIDPLVKDAEATKDYSEEVKSLLSGLVSHHLQNGDTHKAIEEILMLEKKARLASDAASVSILACKILKILKETDQYDLLNQYIVLLCRRRAQLKKVIVDIVKLCMSWIEDNKFPSRFHLLSVIQTIIKVIEGKIFVEVELARLVRILSKIKEEQGDIEEAANILQEVQVEACAGMDRRERSEYILDQMRIVLLKGDYFRCHIISKKFNPKLLKADDFQDIKLKYYEYMVEYYLHENQMIEACRCYFHIYHTKCVLQDEKKWKEALQCHILYLILSHDLGQKDMICRLLKMERKRLDEIPEFKQLLQEFLKDELIEWPLPFEKIIHDHPVFAKGKESEQKRWEIFRKRVLEHNIKVISTYYDCITLSRLANLLGISLQEAETQTSELVYSKTIQARIDRPAGIVRFGEYRDTSTVLNNWSLDIAKLLSLVEESSHLIQNEKMVHAAREKKLEMHLKTTT